MVKFKNKWSISGCDGSSEKRKPTNGYFKPFVGMKNGDAHCNVGEMHLIFVGTAYGVVLYM